MSSTDKALDPGPGAGARGAVGQARRHLAAGLPLRYLGLLLVCLILMKPIMVDSDPRLAPVVKALTGCVFAGILLVHTLRRAPVSTALVLFVLYRWVMLVPTVANGGDLLNWGYATVAQLSILMLIDLFAVAAEPADRRRLLRVMADLLLAYLMINYVMILAGWGTVTGWGDGQLLAQPSYLLGIRTRITDTAFPALLVCLLYESGGPRPWGLRSLMALGLGVVQILTLDVATASVGVVVAVVVYALVLAVPPARRVVSMRGATVLGVAVTVLVVLLRVQVHAASLIKDGLGKSVTLTGRTELWDLAMPILRASPWVGYGVNEHFGAFIPWAGGIDWQAHNQYLQIVHDCGLIGLGLFLTLLWSVSRRLDTSTCNIHARAAFVAVYAALSVMSVTEIYIYNMGLFHLIVFLASRAQELTGDDSGGTP